MREDWIEFKLKDVFDVVTGNTPSKSDVANYGSEIPFVKPPNLWNGTVTKTQEYLTEKGASKSRVLPPFSTLVTCIGNLGRVGLNKNVVAFNQQINAIKPKNNIDPFFTFYQAQSPSFKLQLEKKSSATTVAIVNKGNFETIIYNLAPLPEQRAIVAKIEELFSSLDSGIADLKKAQEQLKIYRQAVLKKAFEGELTKEWRTKQTNLPTGDELLEQIKEERQNHYKQQLEDWKKAIKDWEANGKEGKKQIKPNVHKEFKVGDDKIELDIPHNWIVECVGNLSIGVAYGSGSKSKDSGSVPVIRMGNMQGGIIDWSDLKFTDDIDEIKQYQLEKGDVLFNRTNSPELVGKTVLYKGERPAVFAGYLIRVNHIKQLVLGEYLNYFLNSHPAKVYGNSVKTDGVNQSNINGQKLSSYPISICTVLEQQQVVQEIESRLSVCDKVEESIVESLEKAKALRQSILNKAFEGRLLNDQELAACKSAPDYEPASRLLERIKDEKITSAKKEPVKKKK